MSRCALILPAVLILGRPAAATTIIALPEPELIRHSHAIVVGTVVRTDTRVHPGGRVTTHATLQVNRGLRGADTHEVVTVEVPGGRLPNGLVARSPGAPILESGDLVLGFFESHRHVLRPLGLSYGLLRVRENAQGDLRVFRETAGLHMVTRKGIPVAPGAVALEGVPLEEVVARVQAQLADLPPPPPRGAVIR